MFPRAGDNVVFVRKLYNLFDPSCVKVGLLWTGVYTFWGVFRGQSRIYYKSVRDFVKKCSEMQCILPIMQLLHHICDITMNRR